MINIVHRFTGKIIFTNEKISIRESLLDAIKEGANLRGANLRDADLSHANLSDANLSDANLRGANLSDADLSHANLSHANLSDANLSHANLSDANLSHANLSDANLSHADLRDANLSHANLSHADLRDANLRDANLRDADLRGADLRGADLKELLSTRTIVPEGDIFGWKKLSNGVICKLLIPEAAKRIGGLTSRKCRAEFAVVISGEGFSKYNASFRYFPGETVKPDKFDPDPLVTCSSGLHFFITEKEAKKY